MTEAVREAMPMGDLGQSFGSPEGTVLRNIAILERRVRDCEERLEAVRRDETRCLDELRDTWRELDRAKGKRP